MFMRKTQSDSEFAYVKQNIKNYNIALWNKLK